MEKVDAKVHTIGDLLAEKIYTLGYFQRNYTWQNEHVEDLINDLIGEFRLHKKNADIESSSYFLGSIIINEEEDGLSLIDGQQRLTSLLLLFIHIARACPEIKNDVGSMVFKEKDNKEVCTLNSGNRTTIMKSLHYDENITGDISINEKNIKARFERIDDIFDREEMEGDEILSFFNWVKNHVCIVQIETKSERDAYKIFESANDRGLKLTPPEMLKSYLLSQIHDKKKQSELDELWKKRIDEIEEQLGTNPKEKEDAIKAWLRGSLSNSDSDFDAIGREFHRWVKRKAEGENQNFLKNPSHFISFIEHDFEFYTRWYLQIKKVAKKYSKEHEAIFCNEKNPFTLQYPLILSTIKRDDSTDTIWKKINAVANFIDIYIARHVWNDMPNLFAERSARSPVQDVISKIRGKDLKEIAGVLIEKIETYPDFTIDTVINYMNKNKRKYVHRFLARLSAHLNKEMGIDSSLESYYEAKKFNVEHCMPNQYERDYKGVENKNIGGPEFESDGEFNKERNRFGALVLLESANNISLSDSPYEKKVKKYANQDMILAKTLAEASYTSQPSFQRIAQAYNFKPFDEFLKSQIKDREQSYIRLAKAIWSTRNLQDIANGKIE